MMKINKKYLIAIGIVIVLIGLGFAGLAFKRHHNEISKSGNNIFLVSSSNG